MKKNVGKIDKMIRIAIAALIVVGGITKLLTGLPLTFASIIAIVLVLTSSVSFCPLYAMFGKKAIRKVKI
jgi:hypothetical protein